MNQCLLFFALIIGLIGVKLHDSLNEENLLFDATSLISNTFLKFIDHPNFWSNKSVVNCSSTEPWADGKEVYT